MAKNGMFFVKMHLCGIDFIDDKGKLWVTNTKKGDKPTKKLDADTNQRQKQIFLTNKKSNH